MPRVSRPHPDDEGHDDLGLATQAELDAHAALPHGGGAHPDLAGHDLLGLVTEGDLDAHETAGDPHPTYALDADLTGHIGAGDPHPAYELASEKGMANGYPSLDAGGLIPDAQIPASIARDSELPDLAGHVAAGDPHPAYALDADLAFLQPLDADLTAIAALATTAFGRGLIALADAAALAANHAHGGASSDPFLGSYAPGSFTVPTGDYAVMADRLELTGAQTATLEGTAVLRIV